MDRADVYLQPAAPDPVLPRELVLALARLFLPDGTGAGADRFEVDGIRAPDE